MDDATTRAALRELGEANKFGAPNGSLSVTREVLAERGDFEEAARWVEDHGGYVDRTEYRMPGLGPNYGKLDVHTRLIVPEDALRD